MKFCPSCRKTFPDSAQHCPYDGALLLVRDPYLGTVLSGSYRLERLIGEGGMGRVYEAKHLRLDKRYAVKILRPEFNMNHEALARFEREALTAGRLGHVNIVEVIDFNRTEDGVYFIVTEFLEGRSLGATIQAEGAMTVARAFPIFHQICRALAEAHSSGIVHRDLKPENIFLTHVFETEDFVKVLDFGISKVQSGQAHLTQSGQIIGTPHYMPPEQAEGRLDLDHRADIYSLGAMMYEVLSGNRPFKGDTLQTVLLAVLSEDPAPLAELRPDLPREVTELVERCMAKSPEDRFQDIRSVDERIIAIWQKYGRDAAGASLGSAMPGSSPISDMWLPPPNDGGKTQPVMGPPTVEDSRPAAAPATHVPVVPSGPWSSLPGSGQQSRVPGPGASPRQRRRRKWPLLAGVLVGGLVMLAVVGGLVVWFFPGLFGLGDGDQEKPHKATAAKASASAQKKAVAEQPRSAGKPGDQVERSDAPKKLELKPPAGMVFIRGGAFLMGRERGGFPQERPAHYVVVRSFFMDEAEVSNAKYADYLIRMVHKGKTVRSPWPGGVLPSGKSDFPVTNVTWKEADRYCRSLGRRLPTEEEWEYAARSGTKKQFLYPWGRKFRRELVVASVGLPRGKKPSLMPVRFGTAFGGLFNMIGNAWEWTGSRFRPYPGSKTSVPSGVLHVFRGGGAASRDRRELTATFRDAGYSDGAPTTGKPTADPYLGFRCAADAPSR